MILKTRNRLNQINPNKRRILGKITKKKREFPQKFLKKKVKNECWVQDHLKIKKCQRNLFLSKSSRLAMLRPIKQEPQLTWENAKDPDHKQILSNHKLTPILATAKLKFHLRFTIKKYWKNCQMKISRKKFLTGFRLIPKSKKNLIQKKFWKMKII